ncbi:MAG: type VI secretion system tube protein Hcp [Deltaproteobacteria bacterium]|nr:type VI secretion system tube protein Hcp [Deltaproteobacteria bacterium]
MPNVSYAFVDGIPGSCKQEGREESIQILSLKHTVEIPVDVKDATATGTRRHGAMTLVANIDAATPLMMECVCTSKTIPTVEIKYFNINDEGLEQNYYTIKMEKVRVTKATHWYPNVDDETTKNYKDMIDYELRYDKITWMYTDGNKEFADTWLAPRQ